jgi:ribonuclease HI
MQNGIVCFFDGACEPRNPGGNMGMGAVIFIDGIEFEKHTQFVKSSEINSNNVAEYRALIWILETLIKHGLHERLIYIYGDSQLVVMQMSGKWRIKFGYYVDYAREAKELFKVFKNTLIQWIPREKNEYADKLSKGELIKNNVEFRLQPLNKKPA